ncbi:MAG: hypothetical protein ACKV22_30340 [Bryobacteraceae bacterium]
MSLITVSLAALLTLASIVRAEPLRTALNGLEIAIDRETGCLLHLASESTGAILTATEPSLLDAAYPVASFAPMRLGCRNAHASVTGHSGGLAIEWKQLGPSRPNLLPGRAAVSALVTIRAAPDGRSVIFSARLRNDSAVPVPQVLFPDLSGLRPFHGVSQTELRFGGGVVRPFEGPPLPEHAAPFYVRRIWQEYPPSGYQHLNSLRWIDLGSLRGGLSLFQKRWGTDSPPKIMTLRPETDPTSLRLVWEHSTPVRPGETWESGEFWLTPHGGGWAKGIEVYRQYVDQVSVKRELPAHVRDGIGYQTIWMIESLERDPARAYFRYADLPRVARDSREHGIDELVLWGWSDSFTLPKKLLPRLGTREEFLAAVRLCRDIGVNVAPFYSIQTVLNRFAERYHVKPGTSSYTYHSELVPMFNPFYMKVEDGAWVASDNPVWLKDAWETMIEWIDAGVPSISYDQFSSKSSPGEKPAMVAMTEKLRARARAIDPQSTFSGEAITPGSFERDGGVLDYTWNWAGYNDSGPVLSVLRYPRLNCNVQDSPLVVKQCFGDGLYLDLLMKKPGQANGSALISDVPAVAQAVKQVAARRRQFLEYFTQGTFLGNSVLVEPAPAFVRGHLLGKRLLLVVLNDKPAPQAVPLHVDLAMWFPAVRPYQVRRYEGDGRLAATSRGSERFWSAGTPKLEPLELAFYSIELQ